MNFTSVSGKNWIFKNFNSSDVKKYSEKHSLSEIVAKLLSIRKKNIENIELFLNPTIKNLLPNPLRLKDMENAINRTYQSINKNELIGIFGDYDVDGATSTALLSRYFLSINQKIKDNGLPFCIIDTGLQIFYLFLPIPHSWEQGANFRIIVKGFR